MLEYRFGQPPVEPVFGLASPFPRLLRPGMLFGLSPEDRRELGITEEASPAHRQDVVVDEKIMEEGRGSRDINTGLDEQRAYSRNPTPPIQATSSKVRGKRPAKEQEHGVQSREHHGSLEENQGRDAPCLADTRSSSRQPTAISQDKIEGHEDDQGITAHATGKNDGFISRQNSQKGRSDIRNRWGR